MEETHRAANEIGKLPIERLERGLGEHVRHRDPSVFGLIGVEFTRNSWQGSGNNRLSDRVSRPLRCSRQRMQISPRLSSQGIESMQRWCGPSANIRGFAAPRNVPCMCEYEPQRRRLESFVGVICDMHKRIARRASWRSRGYCRRG